MVSTKRVIQNRVHSFSIQNFLRIVVARRRHLRSGSIRCQHRKVDFGRPCHPLHRVHMGTITDQTTQAKHMHCTLTMSSRCFASPRARDQLSTLRAQHHDAVNFSTNDRNGVRRCGYVYDGPHSMHAINPERGRGRPGTMSTKTPSSHAASKTSDARMYASQ
eukprot:SAG31_NODE_1606_length_7761_cov_4.493996_1_plen_162_part_00